MEYNDGLYTAFLLDYIQAETSTRSYRPTSEVDGMTHFANIVERAMIAFKRRRNSMLPVSTLPIELLAAVFEWAVCTEVQKRYRELQRLRLVCSTWKTAIDTSPALWSVLSSHHSSRTVDIALERSGNHPLSVWHHLPSPSKGGPDLEISRLLARSGMQRWKFVSFQFTSPEPLAALREPAPLLEVLQLRVTNGIDRTYWMEDLFYGELPRLKELRLQSISVPWSSRHFPALRILDLSCIRDQGPTISQLFSILSQCSKLSKLILDYVVFSPDSTDQTDVQPIMSSLLQLQLDRLASASINRILTNLNLPVLKQFYLACKLPRDEPTALFDHRLYLRTASFVSILQNANTDQEFLETMLKIPHLVDVSFTEPNEDIATLLARLSAYDVDEDGGVSWPLPEIHILCLSGDNFDISEVLVMVKSRYGRSESQQGSKNRHPAPLVLLDVVDNTSWNEETLEEIRGIVGDGVLQWDECYDY
ncbi:hypothetical protein FRC01_001986 [Tulasnella sp. 417]|nr:hypothetical protein FRC01_001986 [Tulasnella sp. 417]